MTQTMDRTERVFRGTAVSPGFAIGVVRHVGATFEEPQARKVPAAHVEYEVVRFRTAIKSTRRELEGLISQLDGPIDREAREVLDMHLLVLEDSALMDPVEAAIQEDHDCAEAAYFRVARLHMEAFQRMTDAYFRERALDIRDVAQRVLRHLHGKPLEEKEVGAPAICISLDLTPSETANLDRTQVLGFAIEHGSKTSHTAIVARSLGLPAVVHLHGICKELHTNDIVLLDGHAGLLILNPREETRARYTALIEAERLRRELLESECREPAVTLDGRRIAVGANVEFIEELRQIPTSGAEGIGLFRTEFLYLEDRHTGEARLTETYITVAASAAPELVIFRTLDLGGDKLDPGNEVEANPFLGWRGIRVSLTRKDFFKRQLRAILKASAHGNVAIMYPMISSVQEVIAANSLVEECRRELCAEGIAVAERVQVGAMIEVPSAATTSDLIAPHVDFFSIGTNDLTQYTLAVDRVNERVADLYQPTHPGVLRLIKTVVESAHRQKIWTGMCGEMAGDVSVMPLLLGLGLDELSAATSQVARVKHAVRKLDYAACVALANELMRESDPEVIWRKSAEMAAHAYPELFKD